MMKKTRIAATFEKLKTGKKKAFIPYIMAGDPDMEKTMERVLMLERSGADIIELGVPFSDPLADGPTIQKAAGRAIQAGTTLKKVISAVRELRHHTGIPIILMTYYNPIFKYGEALFIEEASAAGVDGIIVPDLPPEEAGGLIRLSRAGTGLDTIFLVAPTSTEERTKSIVAACSGFVYYVSLTGITGAKLSVNEAFKSHFNAVRRLTGKPIAAGFGIATPEEAQAVGQIADGIIVGSAIVKKFHEEPGSAEEFIKNLRGTI